MNRYSWRAIVAAGASQLSATVVSPGTANRFDGAAGTPGVTAAVGALASVFVNPPASVQLALAVSAAPTSASTTV